jgi:nucleoside-diphosphate-sugar epimerase
VVERSNGLKMSFLVTGGTGFIGSYVVRCLLRHGEPVVCFDRAPDAQVIALFASPVEVIAGDVAERAQVAAAFRSHPRIDRVVHLAYMMGAESEADPPAAMRVNALGAANLFAEACAHGVKRLVFTSSESVYGATQAVYGDRAVNEDDFCSPRDHVLNYSLTKLVNEHLAAKYEARSGIPMVSVRPPVVFGHGRKRGTTAWASDFASLPALGQPVTLPFPESDRNAYIYVADLAEEIYQLSVKPSLACRTYNTGGHTLAAPELVAMVRELLPDAQISFSPDRPNSPFIYRMDDRRIRQELGNILRPMRDAIRDQIDEARRREARRRG